MEFTLWNVFSFLNSLCESCLCFLSTSQKANHTLTCTYGLWLLLLLLCCLVGIPSSPTVWETESRQKHQGRAKRRKCGTRKGCRYYQREEEEKKKLISILKSPLGQNYDIMRFRRMLCPDPFCEVCNRATAEINSLLYPESLEDATSSVSPLDSTDSVTESLFPLSPPFSALRPGDPIPGPLPEPSSPSPRFLSTNTVTPLPDSPSAFPLGCSLPPEPFHPLESKFPAEHSQSQRPGSPSRGILRMDPLLKPEAPLTLNTIFLDPSLSEYTDPLPDLSENDPHQFICSPSRSSSATCITITRLVSLTQSEQRKPEYHLNSSTKTLESGVDKHDAVIALPFRSSKDKPTEQHVHRRPSYLEAWRILG